MTYEAIETIKKGKKTLSIYYDMTPQNPREWDNLGTIVAWHRRYTLGDEEYSSPRYFLEYHTEKYFSTQEGLENATDKRLMELFKKENIVLPVYMYEHSNIVLRTYSFNDRWDSGQVGWIYVSKEKIRKEFNVKRITKKIIQKVKKNLSSEIEVYSEYLDGNVYGYVLEDENGNEIDSCWGFYGYDFKNNGMTYYLPKEFKEAL